MIHTCGASRRDGAPCRRRVSQPGDHCRHHAPGLAPVIPLFPGLNPPPSPAVTCSCGSEWWVTAVYLEGDPPTVTGRGTRLRCLGCEREVEL